MTKVPLSSIKPSGSPDLSASTLNQPSAPVSYLALRWKRHTCSLKLMEMCVKRWPHAAGCVHGVWFAAGTDSLVGLTGQEDEPEPAAARGGSRST